MDTHGERATFCQVEVARHGKFDIGAGLSKNWRLFFKKTLW